MAEINHTTNLEDDLCLLFIGNFIIKSMRLKYEKWHKLITTEEHRVNIYSISHLKKILT